MGTETLIVYTVKEVSYSTVETFRKHNKDSMLYSDDCTAYERQSLFRVKHSKKEHVWDGHIHKCNREFLDYYKRGITSTFY